MSPQRSKWVAILTGAIALLLGIGYLALVQFLDFRGEMLPAPTGILLGLIGG
jgi:hypothetical protein